MSEAELNLDELETSILACLITQARDGVVVLGPDTCCRYANPAACDIIGYSNAALLGRDLLLSFPAREQPIIAELFAAAPEEHVLRRSSVIVRPNGEEREIEYSTARFTLAEQPLLVLTIRDVTDTRRTIRWAAALAQMASSVALSSSLEGTLNALARSVVNATHCIACIISTTHGEPPKLRIEGAYGLSEGVREGLQLSWQAGADSPSLQAVCEGRVVVVQDMRDFVLTRAAYAPVHTFVQQETWGTVACIPLSYRHRIVGVMTCSYPAGHQSNDAEINFLSTLADQAAVAVENARLFAEAQDKAVLEERQRLARELHDSVSQALYGIALAARTARVLLDRDPSRLAEPLDYLLNLADTGLSEMRALIFELRPESLQIEGLVVALEKQTAAVAARHGIHIVTELCSEPNLPLRLKEAMYRISQEALNNIIKHARAKRVDLRLATVSAEFPALILEIHDDGVGFNASASFPGHFGLQSMRERAANLGGILVCESVPGQGTRIRAEIPV